MQVKWTFNPKAAKDTQPVSSQVKGESQMVGGEFKASTKSIANPPTTFKCSGFHPREFGVRLTTTPVNQDAYLNLIPTTEFKPLGSAKSRLNCS